MSLVDPMLIAKILASSLVSPRVAPAAGRSMLVLALYAFSGVLMLAATVLLLVALYSSAAAVYTPAQAWAITGCATMALGVIGILVAKIVANRRARVIYNHMDDTGKALLDALDTATKGLEEPIADHPRSSILLASLAGYLAGNKLH